MWEFKQIVSYYTEKETEKRNCMSILERDISYSKCGTKYTFYDQKIIRVRFYFPRIPGIWMPEKKKEKKKQINTTGQFTFYEA